MNLNALKKRLREEIAKLNKQIDLLKSQERKCHEAIDHLNYGDDAVAKELLKELCL